MPFLALVFRKRGCFVAFVVGLFEAEAVRGADQELLGDDGGTAATSGYRPVLGVDGQKHEPQ